MKYDDEGRIKIDDEGRIRIEIKDIRREWNKEEKREWVKLIFEIDGTEYFQGIKLEEQAEIFRQVCESEDKKYSPGIMKKETWRRVLKILEEELAAKRGALGGLMSLLFIVKYVLCKTKDERGQLTEDMILKFQRRKKRGEPGYQSEKTRYQNRKNKFEELIKRINNQGK